ncbi:MSC_0623 family F1-like ATPase-associated protein [Metamycoplasma alkalescens]|uniref:MSC_0623 family F1-like ATPase-associated protein n=1 Tax=Metamycoplasma alkalescens TaxID=45363 RepID=UPI003D03C489
MKKIEKQKQNLLLEANKKIELLNQEFENLKNQNNFISFDKLISTILLKSNLDKNKNEEKILFGWIKKACEQKYDLVFDAFVISFNLDANLNNLYMVPTLLKNQSSNFEAIDFSSDSNLFNSNFIMNLNIEIKFLLANGFYVEVIKGIIMKKNNDFELFYSQEHTLGW